MNNFSQIIRILDKINYIDMHVHLENYEINSLMDNVDILFFGNSVDLQSYNKTCRLAEKTKLLIPSFGIHPMKAAETTICREVLSELFRLNDFIGEIGLDYFWIDDETSYPFQREILENQLQLVSEFSNIPSIHTKGAEKEILSLLKKYNIKKSIIHWYSGPTELIKEYLDMGCYFTIGPDIFSDSKIYRHIPLDRMFAETDNPTGMPWITGREAQIDDIKKVYKELSGKLEMDEKKLMETFKQNLKEIIKK